MEFSMNWEIMGALGEIVGGLGVILSLLYLAPVSYTHLTLPTIYSV